MKARRTSLEVIYEGQDVSRDITDDLIGFNWKDNASGEADDISIQLKNDSGKWISTWAPRRGDKISVTIVHTDEEGEFRKHCGEFEIDDLSYAGPPHTLSLRAQSAPVADSRRRRRTVAWEDSGLKDIASSVARSSGLDLLYDAPDDFVYDRIDQKRESDIGFLTRVCEEEGYSVKITDGLLVVFDPEEYEAKDPAYSYDITDITSYKFEAQSFDVVSSVTVRYYDPTTGDMIEREVKA